MSKDAEAEDMLPEYDFSGGIRGRYANRFRSERQGLLDAAAAMDRQAWLAHSLLSVQQFEANLVAYWVLALGEKPDEVGRTVSVLLEALDREPFEALRRDLDEHTSVNEEFYRDLDQLIEDRNWLVHRSLHSLSPSRLESISQRSLRLTEQLFALLVERCSARGITPEEVSDRADEVVEQWASGRSAA